MPQGNIKFAYSLYGSLDGSFILNELLKQNIKKVRKW